MVFIKTKNDLQLRLGTYRLWAFLPQDSGAGLPFKARRQSMTRGENIL
eukprot:SAG31_NODE_39564_length_287_cov_0.824468_1_plen_47_part_01